MKVVSMVYRIDGSKMWDPFWLENAHTQREDEDIFHTTGQMSGVCLRVKGLAGKSRKLYWYCV